jgi:hypothetical protein
MADNFLEKHYDSYLSKKKSWENAKKNGLLKARMMKEKSRQTKSIGKDGNK